MNVDSSSFQKKLLNDELYVSQIVLNRVDGPTYKIKLILQLSTLFIVYFLFLMQGNYISNSLLILYDSLSFLSDFIGLILSIISHKFSRSLPNKIYSFGYLRLEIICVLASVFFILLIDFNLTIISISHLIGKHNLDIKPKPMLFFAFLDFLFNLATTLFIRSKVIIINKLNL